MGDYSLIERRSVSRHKGKPQLCFYSNKNYYNKFMNRPVARKSADGLMQWSTMTKRDERMRQESACSKALDLEVKNNSRWCVKLTSRIKPDKAGCAILQTNHR